MLSTAIYIVREYSRIKEEMIRIYQDKNYLYFWSSNIPLQVVLYVLGQTGNYNVIPLPFILDTSEDDAQKSKQTRIYEFESENPRATKGINLSSAIVRQ